MVNTTRNIQHRTQLQHAMSKVPEVTIFFWIIGRGRGIGPTGTALIFLALILIVVGYLTVSHWDQLRPELAT